MSKKLCLGLSFSNYRGRGVKKRGLFNKPLSGGGIGDTIPTETQILELHLTSFQKAVKQEESGMQCLVLKKKKNPTNLQFWTLKNYFQN
jgi:hypothetical protein